MYFPSEQQVPFLPLLLIDLSLERSRRRPARDIEDDASPSDPAPSESPRRGFVGLIVTKALRPLGLSPAR